MKFAQLSLLKKNCEFSVIIILPNYYMVKNKHLNLVLFYLLMCQLSEAAHQGHQKFKNQIFFFLKRTCPRLKCPDGNASELQVTTQWRFTPVLFGPRVCVCEIWMLHLPVWLINLNLCVQHGAQSAVAFLFPVWSLYLNEFIASLVGKWIYPHTAIF